MDKDREETEVAKELESVDDLSLFAMVYSLGDIVGTDVVGVKGGEQETDDENVVVLGKSRRHVEDVGCRYVSDLCCMRVD